MPSHLSLLQLNTLFVSDLKESFVLKNGLNEKPILVVPKALPNVMYKVYIYNCTNPVGGRSLDECKIQLKLPKQPKGMRGVLDESDGTNILIVGFFRLDDRDNGAWIIWETDKHREFAYSTNLQIKVGFIYDTIVKKYFYTKKKGNSEIVVLSNRDSLVDAIDLRRRIDLNLM